MPTDALAATIKYYLFYQEKIFLLTIDHSQLKREST